MRNKHLIFRCNGGPVIGMGHVVGSYRFAMLLKKELSVDPVFLVNENEKISAYLKEKGIRYSSLPPGNNVEARIKSFARLSEQYASSALSFNLDAAALEDWGNQFSKLKKMGFKIFFQDNPTPSYRWGDLVINALPHPHYPGYDPSGNDHCFDGPEYILFDEGIRKYLKQDRKRTNKVERILIAMGGSDHRNITSVLLKVLADIRCSAFIDVVMGPVSEHVMEVENTIGALQLNARLSLNVDDMPERIWKADAGFSSLGLTTYEMVALKLPCLIIAPNALNALVAGTFSRNSVLAVYAGLIDDLGHDELKVKCSEFIRDTESRKVPAVQESPIGDIENYSKILSIVNEILNS